VCGPHDSFPLLIGCQIDVCQVAKPLGSFSYPLCFASNRTLFPLELYMLIYFSLSYVQQCQLVEAVWSVVNGNELGAQSASMEQRPSLLSVRWIV
jgi:hypothetical protein